MTSDKTSLIALIAALAALAVAVLHPARTAGEKAAARETAYERVIRTQTLRCGYIPTTPNFIYKDPNTGSLSGVDYEITEALGRKMGLKIVWAEETGWATMVPALNASRFDAVCNAAWVNPNVAKEAYYARPYYYQPTFVVVRANDNRFDKDRDALNAPEVSIASMDGDNPRFVAQEDFPKAKVYPLPDMAGDSMVMESVATGKADATFEDANDFGDYDKHNPNKLKLVQLDKPVRIYPVAFVLPMGDDKLRGMINAAFDEMIYSGQVDKIMQRYDLYPNSYIPIERPHTLDGTTLPAQVGNSK
ncbi:MAG: transporter substrate-binding domain-containing protein [Alphaproteobacteria bacterium]|nr:transporter substrate-binding domain-containing protein [Alphaproteobacteria bacterium]